MSPFLAINFLSIGIGAALGAWSRWLLSLRFNSLAGWPWGTLAANLIGGYAIGMAIAVIAAHPEWPAWVRLAIVTGFLGGLTTFSSFSAETFVFIERGAYSTAFFYTVASLLGSLCLTALGFASVNAFR